MKLTRNGYTIEGTPAEMIELTDLLKECDAPADPEPVRGGEQKPKPAPKPAAKPAGKKIDWAKAAALRKAGWSYDKIGDELGVSGVTVSAHLNK